MIIPVKYTMQFFLLLVVCCVFLSSTLGRDDFEYHQPSQCDFSTYGAKAPTGSTVMPALRSLSDFPIPPDEFEHAFVKGHSDCSNQLQRIRDNFSENETITNSVVDTLMKSPASKTLLFQYGLLLWGFGPRKCPTHSDCWFGVLTCGNFNDTHLKNVYKEKFVHSWEQRMVTPPLTRYLNWSLSALLLHIRINGREIVSPKVSRLVTKLSSGRKIEVFVGQYVLTVPGTYAMEVRPLSIYPGYLYDFSQKQKKEGFDLVPFIPLLFFAKAKSRDDIAPSISDVIEANYAGENCEDIIRNSPLPFCVGGAHPGRWINIPESVVSNCNISALEPELSFFEQRKWLSNGKADATMVRSYSTLLKDFYRHHASTADFDFLWKPVRNTQANWSKDYAVYMSELSRYANGPICSLAYVEMLDMIYYENRLSLFAPYECRYKIFSSSQAQSCVVDNKTPKPLLFHGDSVVKIFFNEAVDLLLMHGVDLEPIVKKRGGPLIGFNYEVPWLHGKISIALMSTWTALNENITSLDHFLPVKHPYLFLTDMSLHHVHETNMTKFMSEVHQSPLIKLWKKMPDVMPRRKIFQTSSHMYMEYSDDQSIEAYRRRNYILRNELIDIGFRENELWYYTAGILNKEIHFNGNPRKMGGMINLNLICNHMN